MGSQWKISLLAILQCVSPIYSIYQPYCEWNLCNADEYCCDDMTCCPISNGTFETIALVCSVVFVLCVLCVIIYLLLRNRTSIKQIFRFSRSKPGYTNFTIDGSSTIS